MSDVLPYETLVTWLDTVQVPPGPLRLTRWTMLTDAPGHVAWLRQTVVSEPMGQCRLGLHLAMQRLWDAMLVEGT